MKCFVEPGRANTDDTIRLALKAAGDRHVNSLIIASNTGGTAQRLLDLRAETGSSYPVDIVVVTHVCEFSGETIHEMSPEMRQNLASQGCKVITAAHALSGGERSLSSKFGGYGPLEIIAHTLRFFGQGVKVGLEISLMSRDAGAISPGRPVIAIGGSGRGADSAIIVTPGTSASLLSSIIHEIICKPGLY